MYIGKFGITLIINSVFGFTTNPSCCKRLKLHKFMPKFTGKPPMQNLKPLTVLSGYTYVPRFNRISFFLRICLFSFRHDRSLQCIVPGPPMTPYACCSNTWRFGVKLWHSFTCCVGNAAEYSSALEEAL